MAAEKQPIVPPSDEPEQKVPLSPEEQAIFDSIENDVTQPYDPNRIPIDDTKRPLPDEEEWGVPGAEQK